MDSNTKQKIFKNVAYIGIVIVLILLLMRQCNSNADLKRANDIAAQNIYALNDSVAKVNNRAKEAQYQHGLLIADQKNLKQLNAELADELKKQTGKVAYLQKTIINLQGQTPKEIFTTVLVYPDGSNGLEWKFDTLYSPGNGRSIAGVSKFRIDTVNGKTTVVPQYTELTKDEFSIKLITGLKKDKDKYQIFVKSDYPGFKVDTLEGAFIQSNDPIFGAPPKKKRFGVGLNIGPNISYGTSFDFKPKVYVGIGLQLGLQYNFVQF